VRAHASLLATAALAAAVAGCGSGGSGASRDGAGARSAVARYFAALGGHRSGAACAQLTSESQDRLAEFGSDALRLRSHSCSATLDRLFASPAGPRLRGLAHAPVTSVKVRGEEATVAVRGVDAPLKVLRDDGAWRIESSPAGND
jgi:hypothetical protein